MKRTLTLLLCCVCCLTAQETPATATAPDTIAEALRKDVTFLASDELEGRATPSRGLDLAAGFLEKRHKELGLKPLFADSYLEGPLLADATKASLHLHFGDERVELNSSAFVQPVTMPVHIERLPWRSVDPLVAARTSAERSDAAGEVVFIEGEPNAAALARFARLKTPLILLETAPTVEFRTRIPMVVLGKELTQRLRASPTALVSLDVPAGKQRFASNVGALLEGRDKKLRERCIVLSAHYDHIGRGKAVNGDEIRNGADDDASGTAGVLAIAAALARTPTRRSILFVHFYGEESGFLGSRRFAEQPPRPLASMDALFNLEMIGRPDDIGPDCAWITGFGLSDFGTRVAASGAKAGMRFFEHPRLSKMLFASSDNLPFAQVGVVAHSISAGSLHKDYHQPSDEAQTLDYTNMAKVVRALLVAVRDMADADEAPAWVPGSKYAEAAAKLR
ncbi:MAG: M28 family peptidase [Planctomycetes bacterium]|nr:M28 family peptidase [Planctomycetota bacterium]